MSTLLVATTGGHLAELVDLATRLDHTDGPAVWVTHENAESRSLLAHRETVFVPYVGVRDVAGVLRNTSVMHRLFHERGITRAVSTGSGIAIAYLPYCAARGVPAHYIESATRIGGASLTGRIMRTVPGVRVYTQYPHLARGPWRYSGSVFDGFTSIPSAEHRPIRRAVVTLGTAKEFPFRRMLEAVAPLLRAGGALERVQGAPVETLWQTGCTPADGLGIDARPFLAADELEAALARCDLVVGHAGTGSALSAVAAGRFPVLVPRERSCGEVGDDHQDRFARELEDRGLVLRRHAAALTVDDLVIASTRRVERTATPPPFELVP